MVPQTSTAALTRPACRALQARTPVGVLLVSARHVPLAPVILTATRLLHACLVPMVPMCQRPLLAAALCSPALSAHPMWTTTRPRLVRSAVPGHLSQPPALGRAPTSSVLPVRLTVITAPQPNVSPAIPAKPCPSLVQLASAAYIPALPAPLVPTQPQPARAVVS